MLLIIQRARISKTKMTERVKVVLFSIFFFYIQKRVLEHFQLTQTLEKILFKNFIYRGTGRLPKYVS